jgi:hypothetical protein
MPGVPSRVVQYEGALSSFLSPSLRKVYAFHFRRMARCRLLLLFNGGFALNYDGHHWKTFTSKGRRKKIIISDAVDIYYIKPLVDLNRLSRYWARSSRDGQKIIISLSVVMCIFCTCNTCLIWRIPLKLMQDWHELAILHVSNLSRMWNSCRKVMDGSWSDHGVNSPDLIATFSLRLWIQEKTEEERRETNSWNNPEI